MFFSFQKKSQPENIVIVNKLSSLTDSISNGENDIKFPLKSNYSISKLKDLGYSIELGLTGTPKMIINYRRDDESIIYFH